MWMIEKAKSVIFDERSGKLSTTDGQLIATIFWDTEKERLMIVLGIDTDFESEDGKIQGTGLDVGNEIHAGDTIWLSSINGTLFYNEGSKSSCKKPESERMRLQIKITHSEPCIEFLKMCL